MSEKTVYLSPKQFAQIVGVSTSTVRRWEKEGAINSIRTSSGHRRFLASQIQKANEYKDIVSQQKSLNSKQFILQQSANNGESQTTPKPTSQTPLSEEAQPAKPISQYNYQSLLNSRYPFQSLRTYKTGLLYSLLFLAISSLAFPMYGYAHKFANYLTTKYANLDNAALSHNQEIENTSILGATDYAGLFSVNIPTQLNNTLTVSEAANFLNDINAQGQTLDLTDGQIIAPNVIYSLTAGNGIAITGGQDATISLAEDVIPTTFASITIGNDTITATSQADIFEIAAGDNITLSVDSATNKLTIASNISVPDSDNYGSWQYAIDGTDYDNINSGETFEFRSGNDITITRTSENTIAVALQSNIDTVDTINGISSINLSAGGSGLVLADGVLLDLSAITHNDSAPQGFKLPQNTTANITVMSGAGEGYLAWSTDENRVKQFDGSAWTDLATAGSGGSTEWTDAGAYLYPDDADYIGNNSSGGANKITGLYLADSASLTLGTDNDVSFDFSGSELAVTLGSNNFNFDANTLFIQGSTNSVGLGTTAPAYTLDVAGIIQGSSGIRTNSETITDFTGTGLTLAAGALTVDLGTTIEGSEITDGTIEEIDLEATNSPIDNYILSYDSSTGGFTWIDAATAGAIDGAGTAGYVTYWQDSNTLFAEQYLDVSRGGTGLDGSAVTAGQLLIGNGSNSDFDLATLTPGSGINITNGDGTITIASTLGTSISNDEIDDGTIQNIKLANSAIAFAGDTNSGSISLGSVFTIAGGTGISTNYAGSAVTVTNDGVTQITGTTNQITASSGTGNITLSLPQDIHSGASPTFAGLTIDALSITDILDEDNMISNSATALATQQSIKAYVDAQIGGSAQDLFSTIAVSGQDDIVADGNSDTLTFAAGANISLTTNETTDTLTIAATGLDNYQYWTLAGDSGSSNITSTGTATFAGGTGITTSESSGTLTIAATLGTAIDTTEITDATILENDLNATNNAGASEDNYLLSYDHTSGGFTWVDSSSVGHSPVTLAGSYDYLTLSGQEITLGQIDLTTDVTGTLPVANGGTGATTLNDLITLGTHTTGNYLATLADAGNGFFTVTGSGSETAAVTLDIADDSLNFAQFADALTLDASTDIAIDGTNVFSLTNTGTGNSFVVNDQATDTTPFVIDASGNVGIGTTAPGYALQVANPAGQLNIGFTSDSGQLLFRTGGVYGNTVSIDSTSSLRFAQSGTQYATLGTSTFSSSTTGAPSLRIDNNGAAAANPAYSFTGDTNIGMYRPAADTLAFSTSGIESLRIDSSNRIGIGTTAPAYKLDIQGTLGATGLATFGAGINVNSETITDLTGNGLTNNSGSLEVADNYLLNTGDTATGDYDFSGAVLTGASPLTFEGLTADAFETTLAFTDPTADRTITFQDGSGTVAFLSDISGSAHDPVTLAGSLDYLTLSDQEITLNAIDLTTDVTGTLPVANGGTGATSLNDLITLGTHTTGNYLATLADAGNGFFTVTGSGSETAAVTLDIADDSLNFAQFADALTLDASTDIAITGTNVLSLTNTGTGLSFLVNDQSTDTTPFAIDASGNVGIGTTAPGALLEVTTGTANTYSRLSGNGSLTLRNGNNATSLSVGQGGNYIVANTNLVAPGLYSSDSSSANRITLTDGSTGDITLRAGDTVIINDYNSGLEVARFNTDTGQVGIGTTAPSTLLDVAGTLRSTGLATFTSGINVNSETLTDFTGTGLINSAGSLSVADNYLLNSGDTATGNYNFSGAVLTGASPLTFEGLTADGFETTFAFTDPTADNTITFQDGSGTVAFLSDITAAAHDPVTLAGSYNYLTLSGQQITLNAIDLTTDVTGTLPIANGGTGATTLNDLITLGTHTTGNYVATIADSGSSIITVNNSGTETAAVTLGITADSLDFTEFKDALTLDASTDIALSTYDLSFGTNLLYLDSSTSRIGIGTTAPTETLEISGFTKLTSPNGANQVWKGVLAIQNLDVTGNSESVGLKIVDAPGVEGIPILIEDSSGSDLFRINPTGAAFYAPEGSVAGGEYVLQIINQDTTGGNQAGGLRVQSGPSSTTASALLIENQAGTDLLNIRPNGTSTFTGSLGIGTTAPAYTLDVSGIAQATSGFRTNSETVTDFTGTGLILSSGALTVDLGNTVQAYDAALTSIAGLTTSADQMIYTTGSDTYATTSLTAFARTLLDDADATTARTTLGLEIGTDVQAYNANTSLLGQTIEGSEITDNTIEEADLEVTSHAGAGQDGYILSYDNATGGFEWIANDGGSGGSLFTDSDTITYLTSATDDLAIGGTDAEAALFLDVSASMLTLNPFGTNSGETGAFVMQELEANGDNYTGFKAPDSITSNSVFTLPSGYASSANQVLASDTSGNLSWIDVSAGSGGFANWVINDGTTSQTIDSTQTLTIADSSTINGVVSATDTLTYNVIADSLNYTELSDSLVVDANTSINLYSGSADTSLRYYNSDASQELLYLDGATGRIGIGTTAPTSTLSLNGGTGSITTGLTFGDGDTGFYETSDDALYFEFGASSNKYLLQAGSILATAGGSNRGPRIMNEAPTATNPTLLAQGIDTTTGLGGGDLGEYLSLIVSGNEILRADNGTTILDIKNTSANSVLTILNTGSVGIGTTAPTTLLDVAGTLRATGLATFGSGINVNSETITDLTGAGLTNNAGSLEVADNYLLNTGDTATGDYDFSGAVLTGASPLTFEGTTADAFETTFAITDPTADRTITFQDGSGTVAFLSDITGAAHDAVTLAGSLDYLTLSDQEITLNAIDLTTDVTGILPVANGGTGASTLDNLITLGTHTTGNYLATLADAGNGFFTVTGSGSETAAVTLDIANDSLDFAQFADAMTIDADTSFNLYSGSADTDLRFYNSDASSELLYLDGTNSSIGIGTTAPTTFHSETDLQITDGDVTRITLAATDPVSDVVAVFDARGDGTNTVQLGSSSSHPLSFYTNNSRAMLIDTEGDIRIGALSTITGASEAIQLEGDGNYFSFDATSANPGSLSGIKFAEDTTTDSMSISYDGSGSGDNNRIFIRDESGGNNLVTFTRGGLVGIGITAPAASLHALDTTEQLRLGYNASNYSSFTISSGGDLTIDATGGDITLASGDNLNLSTASDLIFGGTTSLAEATGATDSGAYLVGIFDEFDNSSSSTVQDVIDDIDAAIGNRTYTADNYVTDGESITASIDALDQAISAVSGDVPNFDEVYAQSITDGNLTMEIDDTGGLIYNLTTTGDFILQDNGTAFAQFLDNGTTRFGQTDYAQFDTAGNLTFVDADTSSYIYGPTGGHIIMNLTNDIYFQTDGDTDDFLYLSTESNVPVIRTAGSSNLAIIPDGGQVDITGSLSTTGNITLTKADPAIIFNTATATDTDFWLGIREDAGGTDDDMFVIGDGTSPGSNQFVFVNTAGDVGIGDYPTSRLSSLRGDGGEQLRLLYDGSNYANFDVESDGSLAIDAIGSNSTVNFYDAIDITRTLSSTTSDNLLFPKLTNNTSSGSQYIGYFDNVGGTGTTEALLALDNSDSDTAVTTAIQIINAGGGFTNILDIAGTGLSATELGYIDGLNQSLSTSSNVTFGNITATGRLDLSAHNNNVGLNLPTNAGAPSAVTGTAEGDIVYDTTGDALYIYDGSSFTEIGGSAFSSFNTAADTGTGSITNGETLTINGGTNGIDTSLSGDTYTLNLDTTEIGSSIFGSGSPFIWIFNAGTTDPQIAFLDGQIAIGSVSALSMSSVTELNCTDCIDFDDLSDTLSLDTDTSISAGTGEELTYTKSFTNNTSENGFVMNFTASDTGAATTAQYGLYLDNLASTEALDASLVIDNSDADDAVGAAIRIVNAGGGFTNILDIAGTGLSATELGYIDGLNQSLSTSSNVTFGNITATGRLDLAAHTNNVGLNLPTNAGAPSAVTGTAEGDIVYDTTGDALYIYDGSAFTQVGGGGYAGWTYSLDSVSQDTIASGNTLNLSGGTGITLTDTGTRDFDIAINTTEIGTTTFGSGSGITWTFDAGATDPTLAFASNSLTIGSAATITASNTTTLTANSLATINTAAGLSLGGATSLTFTADNATINGSDAANGNLTLQGTSNATRTTSYLNLQPSGGLVGIGTTAPNTLLEVNNGSSTSNIRIASNVDTYLDLYADQDNNSAHDSVVRFYEGTTGRYAMGYDASANIFSIDSGSGLDDTNLLTLTSTGLGIGTTAPSTPLHIYHATNDTLATFQSGDSIARLQITDSADDAYLFTQSSKIGLGFESSLSTLTNGIVIDSTGVGIGTTAPAYKLDVNINASSTYAARIFNDQNTAGHGLLIQTDGTGNGSYPLHVSTGTTTDALVINGAGDLLLGSTDIAAANLAYDLSDNEFRANQAITFRPDGDLILKADDDTDDYLYLSTETNVPTLRTAGTSNLAIIPDGGQVNITGDLSLSGGDLIGAGNESIDLGEAIDGITFLVNSAAELSLSATSLYASTADGLQLGSTTNEFAALYLHDDTGINFGADQNFLLAYDETTDDALELGDGTNTFLRVTDNGTTGTLSMLDGNFLDLSAILHNDTAVQGFRLPNTGATPSNPVSGEGYLAWDATDNELLVYNGSSWATVSTGGGGTTWDAIGDAAANNTLNLGSYTTTFNFTGTTTTGWTYNTDSLTSGIGTLFSGDALTSGDLLSLTSTSTALTSGNLLSLDWSPTGSTEIFSTGDLFSLNIGQYGNADNLFAIYDNGSDVFTVSQNGITSAVPHSFTASGDVSFAYDAVFTNQTSSLIDSYGPLTISSGESFENNDLTLRAYGTGAVVIDNSSLELYTGENLVLDTDDSGDTYITHDSTNNRISFVVDGNEAVRFNNSGESAQFDDAIDTSADFDIAETYPTFDTSLKPGDLVMIDTNDTSAIPAVVKKANSQANTNILGIVSTSPAYTMGAGSFAGEFCSSVINTGLEAHLAQTRTQLEAQLAQENDDPANLIQATLDERMVSEQSKAAQCFAAKQVLIALAGRVPTKISNSNGDIKAGDQLILSSDKPGVAVKQTKAGISIGVALENGNGKDKVMAFVNRTYYDPNSGIAQINDNGQLQLTNSSEQFIADIVAQVTAEVIAAQDLKVSDQQLTEDLAALISDGDTPAIISQPLALLDQMLIDNDLTVFGETQLADTTINGSLTISGNVSGETSEITQLTQNSLISTADEFQIIANSINFNNILTINEDGDVQIAGNLDVQGDTTLNTLAANQAVLGTTTIADSLTITGSQLTVENESTSSADLNTPESTPAAQLATTITSTGLQTQEATVSAITADTIIVNGNTAGTITIPAGQTSITVEFSNPHTQAPIVTASALGHFVQNAVTDITSQGFTIQIPQANTQNLKFNWIALGLQTQ